jgi:hypothetical protein
MTKHQEQHNVMGLLLYFICGQTVLHLALYCLVPITCAFTAAAQAENSICYGWPASACVQVKGIGLQEPGTKHMPQHTTARTILNCLCRVLCCDVCCATV